MLARRAYERRAQAIKEYETRYERANDALAGEVDDAKRFDIFKRLPLSVQLSIWRSPLGFILCPEDNEEEHERRRADLEARVKANKGLHNELDCKENVPSDETSYEESDMSYKTVVSIHKRERKNAREERLAKRLRLDDSLVYAAVVEALTENAVDGTYPAARDVNGWANWLDNRPLPASDSSDQESEKDDA
jgi:hypothetical protein